MTISEERLKEVLVEFFDERARVDAATHGVHHEWIKERIEAEKARREMCQEITKVVIGWSIPALLGYFTGAFKGIWFWLQHGQWPQ